MSMGRLGSDGLKYASEGRKAIARLPRNSGPAKAEGGLAFGRFHKVFIMIDKRIGAGDHARNRAQKRATRAQKRAKSGKSRAKSARKRAQRKKHVNGA